MGEIQADQLRRYIEIKQSDLPSAVAAKKTKEFRCPPREQMNAILGFKNFSEEELEEAPCGNDLRSKLLDFHGLLMVKAKIPGGKEEEGDAEVGFWQPMWKHCNATSNTFTPGHD